MTTLLRFHLQIVLANETTNERVKRTFEQHRNPYDRGAAQNCLALCCSPLPESRLRNLREIMPPEAFITENVDPAKLEAMRRRSSAAGRDSGGSGLTGYSNYNSLSDVEMKV